MKRILFLFSVLSLLSGKSLSQTDSITKTKKWSHEMGSNVYGLTIGGGDFYSFYKKDIANYCFSGLYFKFYNRQNAIRTSVDYLQRLIFNYNFYKLQNNNNLISSKGLQLSVGYQRMLSKRNKTFFIFADLAYKGTTEVRNLNVYNNYWDYYGNRYSRRHLSAFSIVPGLGLKLNIKKKIILTFESSAQFFYQKEFSSYVPEKHKVIGINIKPLNCSIGFKF